LHLLNYHRKWNMRELQIIQSIFDQVLHQVQEDKDKGVTRLRIALGELAELAPTAFQTEWRELSKATPAEHAQLRFRLIAAEVQCMACFRKYHPLEKKIVCPYCGSFGAKILTGEECFLESVETDND
jgi:hydrogenase nickel incorporation protein HypA/HybF